MILKRSFRIRFSHLLGGRERQLMRTVSYLLIEWIPFKTLKSLVSFGGFFVLFRLWFCCCQKEDSFKTSRKQFFCFTQLPVTNSCPFAFVPKSSMMLRCGSFDHWDANCGPVYPWLRRQARKGTLSLMFALDLRVLMWRVAHAQFCWEVVSCIS